MTPSTTRKTVMSLEGRWREGSEGAQPRAAAARHLPCLLLDEGERQAALGRLRLPSRALGSSSGEREAAGKQWHEPSLLLSSLSAGLRSAQALGVLQGNGTAGARAAALRAPASVVGLAPTPGPPYLTSMKQWAAVRTHCGLMREPPQMCTVPPSTRAWMLTIQGQAPGRASVPPTTRDMP